MKQKGNAKTTRHLKIGNAKKCVNYESKLQVNFFRTWVIMARREITKSKHKRTHMGDRHTTQVAGTNGGWPEKAPSLSTGLYSTGTGQQAPRPMGEGRCTCRTRTRQVSRQHTTSTSTSTPTPTSIPIFMSMSLAHIHICPCQYPQADLSNPPLREWSPFKSAEISGDNCSGCVNSIGYVCVLCLWFQFLVQYHKGQ